MTSGADDGFECVGNPLGPSDSALDAPTPGFFDSPAFAGWREPFELAWESFAAGSPGVGAVVVDAEGVVVARGRSRRHETAAPPGQLAGSRLAHAEVNALAVLPDGDHRHLTLYTTLQSCLLCTAAAAVSRVGTLCFAGPDPAWDCLAGIPDLDPVLADRWPITEGPLGGLVGAWASLVPLLDLVERSPDGAVVAAFERTRPTLTALARDLVAENAVLTLRRLTLEAALAECRDRLTDTI